jgi:broad specificity phosphatase PhoE
VDKRDHTDPQTGVSDIPLTANGERMVKEMAPRMVGEKSMPPHSFQSKLIPDLIHPDQIRHILVSPRQRAQKTAALVRPTNML